jgi:hypothetical protein
MAPKEVQAGRLSISMATVIANGDGRSPILSNGDIYNVAYPAQWQPCIVSLDIYAGQDLLLGGFRIFIMASKVDAIGWKLQHLGFFRRLS